MLFIPLIRLAADHIIKKFFYDICNVERSAKGGLSLKREFLDGETKKVRGSWKRKEYGVYLYSKIEFSV